MMRGLVALMMLALAACGASTTATTQTNTTSAAAVAPTAAQLQAAGFAAYPVPAFTGPRRMPNFYGAQSAYRQFRTVLGEGAAQGPNFAGQYGLAQIGCGTNCNTTYQIDFATGGIREMHFSPESGTGVEIKSRADSALLKTQAFILPSTPDGPVRCHFENYVWRDGQLASLGHAEADGPCPDDQ